MSDRLVRKDIKQDEFVATVGRGVDYAQHHGKQILLAIGGLVAAAVLVFGVVQWRGSRSEAAQNALADAIRVANARVDATAAKPDDPTAPVFATEADRRARAKAAFETVVKNHGDGDAGSAARIYLGNIAAEEGRLDDARALWQQYLDQEPDGMLAAATRLSLWELDREQGKSEAVAAEVRAMLDDAKRPLPEDALLNELAKTLDALGKPEEAKAARQRILDEFPRSAYRAEAQRAIGQLPSFQM